MIWRKKSANITELRKKLGLLLVTLSVVLSLGGILADILENFLMLAKLEKTTSKIWLDFWQVPKFLLPKMRPTLGRKATKDQLCHLKKVGFFVPLVAPLLKKPKNFREINVVPRPQILISRQNVETSPIDPCRVVLPEISWFFPLFWSKYNKKIFFWLALFLRGGWQNCTMLSPSSWVLT